MGKALGKFWAQKMVYFCPDETGGNLFKQSSSALMFYKLFYIYVFFHSTMNYKVCMQKAKKQGALSSE